MTTATASHDVGGQSAETPADAVTQYAWDVVEGRTITGRLVRLACERHLRDLVTGAERGLAFDVEAADRAFKFYRYCRHSKGKWAGRSFELELWQRFIVGSIMGWKTAAGLRRFRIAYVEVPRKNGKSTLAAGLGLLLTFFDGEPGAEGYVAATKRDQAKIIFSEMSRMVARSPHLRGRIVSQTGNLHSIDTASKMEPLGADADNLDGLNMHDGLIDELHAHKTGDVWGKLDTATGSREQPLIFAITTAGFDRRSVCWNQHDYGVKVLEEIVEDDSFFAYIACADEGDDWRLETTWRKANPNFGISVNPEDLRKKAAKAEAIVSEENWFRRMHLDEWTEQESRWVQLHIWDAQDPRRSVAELKGQPCFGGLDLASTRDIAAFVLLFPDGLDAVDVLPFFWVPRESIERRALQDRVPYPQWAAGGLIEATAGETIDYDVIRKRINELHGLFNIQSIGTDPWNAGQLVNQLKQDGFTVVEIMQSVSRLSGPTKNVERLMLERGLRHGGNKVLRWMASNAVVRQDADENIRLDKAKSGEKIDGLAALVDGMSELMVAIDQMPPWLAWMLAEQAQKGATV